MQQAALCERRTENSTLGEIAGRMLYTPQTLTRGTQPLKNNARLIVCPLRSDAPGIGHIGCREGARNNGPYTTIFEWGLGDQAARTPCACTASA